MEAQKLIMIFLQNHMLASELLKLSF
uniref:Uncharacterized protein n=1 Tax=Arundo donax TaxID=35708 RepID=A0A0A9H1B1_ARUDO